MLNDSELPKYGFQFLDIAILKYNVPGTAALNVWYNSSLQDYATTRNQRASGYTLVNREGYIFTATDDGLVGTQLYYDPTEEDFATRSTPPSAANANLWGTVGYGFSLTDAP